MNCLVGQSNRSVSNYIIDDPLVTEIHIALIAYGRYIHWFAFTNSSIDYPVVTACHYNFTYIYYPSGRIENNTGYEKIEIKRNSNVATLEFTSYDRSYLDKYIGSSSIDTETHAKRIEMRFFTDCDIRELTFDSAKRIWNAKLITLGELYNNDRIFAEQIVNSGNQILALKTDLETANNLLASVQSSMRVLDRTLKQQVKSLLDAQAQIIKLDGAVGTLIEMEKTVIQDDTNLKEAVEKIQIFLKNIQIATSVTNGKARHREDSDKKEF